MRFECSQFPLFLIHLLVFFISFKSSNASQNYQWSYDSDVFGGPDFWGLVEKDWWMCKKGRLQSPIDIQPDRLLFDASVKPVRLDKLPVLSEFVNTGQMVRIRIGYSAKKPSVNITSGPLYGYRYRVQRIDFHMGRGTENGSEHTINGRRFPMEVQLVAFNTDLYPNFTAASKSPHGIAILSVLVDFGTQTNQELIKLTVATASISYKDQRVQMADFEPWRLLPFTRDIITYEGSLTSPGCHETVTWIILNQPIFITREHVSAFGARFQKKNLKFQFEEWSHLYLSMEGAEKVPVAPNFRKIQETNNRLVRTNIQHKVILLFSKI
ncbi:CRE-CAH-1 protein [Caenorhabditis remanei]|uniref:CRE-CAH-1 protein n=1 Tax=Caenorhabditis remanei TaxID=31234 RepID=E3MFX5_CAERE|nr:CRE-CAH-1 protein [Caenorhabditis remanei]